MKAITLIQPWATLIALGYKTYETRSWQTYHRGLLAIHAGLGQPAAARQVCETDPIILAILQRHGLTFDTLPRGRVLAVADVYSMHQCSDTWPCLLSDTELACGDYGHGRWAWRLTSVLALKEPVAVSGTQSIWQVPRDIALRIEATAKTAPIA